jgi:hypothetical protein
MSREISAICLAGGGLVRKPFSLLCFVVFSFSFFMLREGKGDGVEGRSEKERRIVRLEMGTGI